MLHLAARADWERARETGAYTGSTRGADLAAVGYVHASTSRQLPRVLDLLYGGEPMQDYLLLVVELRACAASGSAVRWEVPPGAGEPFPHIYGPVPLDAVRAALPVTRGEDGAVQLPDLSGLAVQERPSPASR